MDEQLIRLFLQKKCTPAEAEQVLSFLKGNPEVLEKLLGTDEWQNTDWHEMDQAFWEEVWDEIQERRNVAERRLISRKWMIAASLVAALAATFIWVDRPDRAYTDVVTSNKTPVEFSKRVRMNNTSSAVSIELPDSSTVLLHPGSTITYQEPFPMDRRDIYLVGKGRFKVRKDSDRPFTVFAGELATTAIGTEFTVNNTDSNRHLVSVQLHSGKVVVKQTGIAPNWQEDIYLKPGQQLTYDYSSLNVRITPIQEDKPATAKTSKPPRKKTHMQASDGLEFVNASLSEVLMKLENKFGADILYDSAALGAMNFTGKISPHDSLGVVLKVITHMNGLELVEENGRYTILGPK